MFTNHTATEATITPTRQIPVIIRRTAGTPNCELYQLRKKVFTAMASQTDLKTLLEFTGHTQVSTVMGSYVFATSESMKSAVNGMDRLRPRSSEI